MHSEDIQPFGLLEGLVLEAGFEEELMERLPEETPKPELIARFETVKRKTKESCSVPFDTTYCGPISRLS